MLVQNSSVVQEKPFACDAKGCDMTFTNKDHLDWHRKKHEMMLNLGLVNKTAANEVADQTPTPTRFIRNCEEVGLFQDLQNMNPFDEIFKKAVDLVKSGVTLEVQENNSDDTLHTPHILPHITESQLKQLNTNSKNDSDGETFTFPSTNEDTSDSNSSTTIAVDEEQIDLKEKIKKSIQNKIKKELIYKEISQETSVITIIPLQNLSGNKTAVKENNCKPDDKIEKIREMNRAAQNRCRKRKRQLWKEMEDEVAFLRQENKSLKQQLETIILQHSKCQVTNQGAIMASIITPESSQTTATTTPAPVPLLIQIIPNTQISLVSPEATSKPNTTMVNTPTVVKHIRPKQEVKQQLPNKIIPNILLRKKS